MLSRIDLHTHAGSAFYNLVTLKVWSLLFWPQIGLVHVVAIFKSWKIVISPQATWPILMKFGVMMHIGYPNMISHKTFENLKIQDGGRPPFWKHLHVA